MYDIVLLQDQLRHDPSKFNRNPTQDLIEQIELKYCNCILQDVGLGMGFYDFVSVDDAIIFPGDGGTFRMCKFRLIFFRPSIGEVMEGKIIESRPEALKIELEFFEDIWIPVSQLHQPSIYHSGLHYWKYQDGDESLSSSSLSLNKNSVNDKNDITTNTESIIEDNKDKLIKSNKQTQKYAYNIGSRIRFRVKEIEFNLSKQTPKGLQTFTLSEDSAATRIKDNSIPIRAPNEIALVPVKSENSNLSNISNINNREILNDNVLEKNNNIKEIIDTKVADEVIIKEEEKVQPIVQRRRSTSITQPEEMLLPPDTSSSSSSSSSSSVAVAAAVPTILPPIPVKELAYQRPACMRIIGGINEDGLGPIGWWD